MERFSSDINMLMFYFVPSGYDVASDTENFFVLRQGSTAAAKLTKQRGDSVFSDVVHINGKEVSAL